MLTERPRVVNSKDSKGRTCLHHAVLPDTQRQCLSSPLMCGRAPDHECPDTAAPRQAAKGHAGITRILLLHGANPALKVVSADRTLAQTELQSGRVDELHPRDLQELCPRGTL